MSPMIFQNFLCVKKIHPQHPLICDEGVSLFLKAVKLHFNTDVFDSLLETAGISGSAVFDISNML